MSVLKYDVCAIGNAMVDVLAKIDEADLVRLSLTKGQAQPVDMSTAKKIFAEMGPVTLVSGGSAGNTAAGLASFGAAVAFIGKVADDQFGAHFTHDMQASGIDFCRLTPRGDKPSGHVLSLITPDADRTMCFCVGTANDVHADEIDSAPIEQAALLYIEGYMWLNPDAQPALMHAIHVAKKAGRRVALSMSDPFCATICRDLFLSVIKDHVDILFANEDEAKILTGANDFDTALQQLKDSAPVVVLTRNAKGSVVISGDEYHVIDAVPVTQLVDTTGAGDQYAAGFLFAMARGFDLKTCGLYGSLAAAEVISHIGARPEINLADYVAARLKNVA